MRSKYLSFIFLAAGLTVSSAQAQTAGQTVAFILYGVEDGRTVQRVDGQTLTMKQESNSPSTVYSLNYSGGGKPTWVRTITISPIDGCNFDVSQRDQSNGERTARFNFSGLTTVSDNTPFLSINFHGQCPIKDGQDGKCETSHLMLPEYGVDRSRVNSALEYFKATFCAGSAF